MKLIYNDFKGVDFANEFPNSQRSPDALNMWKNYKDGTGIETRPSLELVNEFPNEIFGVYRYQTNSVDEIIVHSGTKLYRVEEEENVELFIGMTPSKSSFFVHNNILFIKDSVNYLEYDGVEVKEVVGTIPMTSLSKKPNGELVDLSSNPVFQSVNLLQPKRKNGFVADGVSTDYYLDAQDLDSSSVFNMIAEVNGLTKVEGIDFTVNRTTGVVTFNTPPPKPLQDGENNVIITYSKTTPGYADRIKKCTILCEFDKRMFFSGNQDYPNTVFHSELEDPRYFRDNAYYTEGLDLSPVKTLIPGNDVLWVIKKGYQGRSTVFYHTPTIDYTYGMIYPSRQSNVSVGCESTGINFNDDIVFFSKRGLESITGEINSEKLLSRRSSMVEPKLLQEKDYDKMQVVEYEGYLVCMVNSHVYLADSRQKFVNENTGGVEYEWYYWEVPNMTFVAEVNNVLYFGDKNGKLYSLTGDGDVESYWVTPKTNAGAESLMKVTNKRGGIATVKKIDKDIEISVKTNNDNNFKKVNDLNAKKGYIVYKIKEKKWKDIQLKFKSNRFGLFSCELEVFAGKQIKR